MVRFYDGSLDFEAVDLEEHEGGEDGRAASAAVASRAKNLFRVRAH